MKNFTQRSIRSQSEHTKLLLDSDDGDSDHGDAVGLAERNGRLQMLVGDLLRKNQELRLEVELFNEKHGNRNGSSNLVWI